MVQHQRILWKIFVMGKKVLVAITHLLFPYPCDLCQCMLSPGDFVRVCMRCYSNVASNAGNTQTNSLSCIRIASYKDCFWNVRNSSTEKFLYTAKFSRHPSYIWLLRDIILDSCTGYLQRFDTFIPVPSHYRDVALRRFSLVFAVTQALAKCLKKSFCPMIQIDLQRKIAQKTLGRKERIQNVRGKFFYQEPSTDLPALSGSLLVVDDVVTTGSTLNEIFYVLRRKLPSHIIGAFAFARTV